MTVPGSAVLLSGVVGSTAYGLAGPHSDIDRLGVFAVPTTALHGLHPPTESHVTTRPDVTLHEARKWCRLALGGNPTVTELVWLPDDLYETRTPLGDDLIGIRDTFLSAGRVRDAYLGYAAQQFRKIERRVDGTVSAQGGARNTDTGPIGGRDSDAEPAGGRDSDAEPAGGRDSDAEPAGGRDKVAKHARHLARLVHQGRQLYTTGRVDIRLTDPQWFLDFGRRVADGGLDEARRYVADAEADFADARTPLPERPDESAAERWLRAVRAAHLGRYSPVG
ncbi:MAG: nucleotidyltransferase domain-containing protein [Actinocatenispora sp.]